MAAQHPTSQQLLEALLDENEDLLLLDNLIAAGEAAFLLISRSNMSDDLKLIAFQVEKRFRMYSNLLQVQEA